MGTDFERTFVVAVPVVGASEAFVDTEQRDAWMSGSDRMDDPSSLEVFEQVETKIGPREPQKRLSWSQRQPGLDDWYENVVTFEEVTWGILADTQNRASPIVPV